MPNLKPSHTSELDSESLNRFLEGGWFLALDPERILVGWGEWKNSPGERRLFTPDFYMGSTDDAWWSTESCGIFERGRFAALVLSGVGADVNAPTRSHSFSGERFQWVEPSRAEFDRQFATIREGMRERGLCKAVPVVFARAEVALTKERRREIIANALSQPTHLFPYGFWRGEEGMIGVTPEILFSQHGELAFETVALAGTRAKGQDERASTEALLNDAKERHEHQLVIDDVAAVLNKMGKAEITQTGVVDLPSLIHLKTKILAKLTQPQTFDQITQALHPTPALGLSPRALGFSEMRKWDSREDRLRYGAPFGVRYRGEDGIEHRHCVVAIRNIQWKDREMLLGSGCGIVPASEVGREWQELQLKRDSVKRMLGV